MRCGSRSSPAEGHNCSATVMATRRVTLREALGLWRGDAMGEFLAVEACEAEARRLEEMRLVAIEDRLDAELASGAASELVAELESLVVTV